MSEFEKLAWLIAEEFVQAFESMEMLLDESENIVVKAAEPTKPRVMTANASSGARFLQ